MPKPNVAANNSSKPKRARNRAKPKKTKRKKSDAYLTPSWCVHRLLDVEELDLPRGRWLEPAAGPGRIINAINSRRKKDVKWDAVEFRKKCKDELVEAVGSLRRVVIGDFLSESLPSKHYDVIFTNPPFSFAMNFIEKCLPLADHVVMLLRLGFLGSARRADFFRQHPPDVYLLPDRPSFLKSGKTDNSYYAWCVWRQRNRAKGRFRVLSTTPQSERKAT
jgi:hypothetical protein